MDWENVIFINFNGLSSSALFAAKPNAGRSHLLDFALNSNAFSHIC